MARPTLLETYPDIAQEIIKYVQEGNYISTACQACGVDERTYYNWIARADEKHPNYSSLYGEFLQSIKKAEAIGIAEVVGKWKNSKANEWPKWATFLERRDKGNWSKLETVNQNVKAKIGLSGDDIMRVMNDLEEVGKQSQDSGTNT